MSRAQRWHALRNAQWRRPAEARIASLLSLAAHELGATAAAAEARGEAKLAADLRGLAQVLEQLERDVLATFCSAVDRQIAAEEANPQLPIERR